MHSSLNVALVVMNLGLKHRGQLVDAAKRLQQGANQTAWQILHA